MNALPALPAMAGLYSLTNGRTLQAAVADEMAQHGMEPVDPFDIRMDGVLCRFDCTGDAHGKNNGWAVIFAEGVRPVAVFGHWARGIHETVVLGKAGPMTSGERERAAMAVDAAQRERARVIANARERARREANARWQGSLPASDAHPYLVRKHIPADGLRACGTSLLVPLRDEQGVLHNLQTIRPDGKKRFLTGGKVSECYAAIGAPCDSFLICEGLATGMSLHMATGRPVAVAFSAGNLYNVGAILHRKYPDAKLTFCADNDVHPDRPNVGVERARAAARLIPGGAYVAIPPIAGDWNDYINSADGGLTSLSEELIHE